METDPTLYRRVVCVCNVYMRSVTQLVQYNTFFQVVVSCRHHAYDAHAHPYALKICNDSFLIRCVEGKREKKRCR